MVIWVDWLFIIFDGGYHDVLLTKQNMVKIVLVYFFIFMKSL